MRMMAGLGLGRFLRGSWWVRSYGLEGPAAASSASAGSAASSSSSSSSYSAATNARAAPATAVGPAEHTLVEVVEAEAEQQQRLGGDHVLRCPVVLVEGFLGGGSAWYWNQCIRQDKVIFAKLGPVSSLHDRACELFYQLKGGTGTPYTPAPHARAQRVVLTRNGPHDPPIPCPSADSVSTDSVSIHTVASYR